MVTWAQKDLIQVEGGDRYFLSHTAAHIFIVE